MRINKKIVIGIVSFLCIMLIWTNFSYALNTGAYSGIYNSNGSQASIKKVGGYALGVVQTLGMGIAVVMLVILGIKYIMSSPEDKATIKDKAVMYVVGAVIIFAASGLVGLVGRWAENTMK